MEMETRIKEIIAKCAGADISEITDGADLRHDLGMDSLDIYESYSIIGEEFAVEISDADAFNLDTVSNIVECARKYIDAK